MEFRRWLENEESQEQGVDGKYWVLTRDLDVMKAKLEKLNRRAAKLGMPPVSMDIVGRKVVKTPGPDGRSQEMSTTQVQLVGAAPKLKGWTFVARIVHGEGGNMIMGSPGQDVPTKYRTAPPSCEHCRSTRNRKDTFVLKSDAGEYKQVGTNCLRDFLGTDDPAAYVLYFSELKSLTDSMEGGLDGLGGGRRSDEVETVNFLATTIAVIRKFGFVSKRISEERNKPTTASEVSRYFFSVSTDKETKKFKEDVESARRPDDRERAEKMVEWARSLKDAGNDDLEQYLWNLSVAAEGLTVNARTAGLMASLPSAYDRANGASSSTPGRSPAEAPPAPTLKAGDKFEGVLTVEKVRSWSTDYGVTTLHVMKDDAGQTYKWKASKESLDEGLRVRIKGTVKGVEPDRYNNNIPTVELTRCKVVEKIMSDEERGVVAGKDDLAREWAARFGSLEPFVNLAGGRALTEKEVEELCRRYVAPKMFEEEGNDLESMIRSAYDAMSETPHSPAHGLDYDRFSGRFLDDFAEDPAKASARYASTGPAELKWRAFLTSSPKFAAVVDRMKEVANGLWEAHKAETRYGKR